MEFEIINLRMIYGAHVALDKVNLKIERGSLNFILGANGSGKSTLMRCLAGHQYWTSGEILRRGESRQIDRKDFNANLHFVSEDIWPPMVPLGQLRDLYRAIYAHWNEDVFARLLKTAQISPKQNLAQVSRGQRMQGLLALILATHPETLILDEITAVLDPFVRGRLIMEIEALQRQNQMTVFLATNIATELVGLNGRFILLENGKVSVDQSSVEVVRGYQKFLVPLDEIERARREGLVLLGRNDERHYRFIAKQGLAANFALDQRSVSLDEVFVYHSDRKIS